MNTAVLASLLRSVLKMAGAFLLTKGYIAAGGNISAMADMPDAVGALCTIVGIVMSWNTHKSPPSDPGAPKPPPAAGLLILCGFLALSVTGCKNLATTAFQAELAAATTADASMRGYGQFWQQAIKYPAAFNTSSNRLWQDRKAVSALSVKIGSGIEISESLRHAYETNAAVRPQLSAAVLALTANTAQIVPFVSSLLTVTNK